ncbi:MAG: sterol desaturase family protein [Nocardioidaceae bacterium]
MRVDLTVAAIPAFIGAMGTELAWQRRQARRRREAGLDPAPGPGDYQLADTMASLTMGVGSLAAPWVAKKLLDPLTPGRGRLGAAVLGTAVVATAATTALDVLTRRARAGGALPEAGTLSPAQRRTAPERVGGATAVAAVASTMVAAATTWSAQTSGKRLFASNRLDLGSGALATAVAVLGWDFIYYWNHRLSHESRWLWAVHVVHHSSERYNLSTALRQPVAEGVTMTVPYGLLALLGVRPSLIEHARGLNLIYQFWIHTEAIRSIGRLEKVLNTPSHHRVHHGSNRHYLDRNHGSILIVWDRLFGTFEREDETVVYGLTRNIDTYNPVTIATHEWADIARDVAGARTWRDRWSFLLRRPGWAYLRRTEAAA